jgi:hypothetical protein
MSSMNRSRRDSSSSPSLDLIVERNGANLYDASKGEGFWAGIERYVFNPVIEAVAAAESNAVP